MYRYLCYTYRQIELKKANAYRFAFALLHYGLRSLLYIGFSLKKFVGPQGNP